MYGYIYESKNKINGKKYIGQHKSNIFENTKYIGSGIIIKTAIKKYGKENFEVRLLEECSSKKELNEKEKYWIKYFNADNDNNYYNMTKGGDGNTDGIGWKGKHHTKQAKEKIGLAHKNKKIAEEQINKYKNTISKRSEEQKKIIKKHMSKAHIGYIMPNEQKEKITNTLREGYKTGKYKATSHEAWNKGRKLTEEECKKQGDIIRGRIHITDGFNNKMIYPDELEEFEQLGWKKGRTIKKIK